MRTMGGIVEAADDDVEDVEDVEEAWEGSGLRGYVQKPTEPWRISRQHFPSKAGGAPAWLDPVNLPTGQRAKCDVCDEPLQFVLQVYSPDIDGNEAAFHRTLFVFMCTSLACLQQDQLQQKRGGRDKCVRSVKVFRSQLPRANSFYSSEPPRNDGREPLLKEGPALCSWCGTWKGDKRCGGCRQTRYCCRSHQMKHWRGDHAAFCRRVQEQEAATSGSKDLVNDCGRTEATEVPKGALGGSVWPEFQLFDDDLEESTAAGTEINKLVADYEKKTAGKDYSAKDVEELEESSPEEQHWAAFQAKIAESPDQVMWYCRSSKAKPLWPKLGGQPRPSDIPTCSVCGSIRSFEFQILPQLLYFFDVKDTTDSLDWGTIAVYSCEKSCTIQGYCEEFAWVQPGFT